MADNNKFKEYWNTHPEEVEEICRKFSEKYVDKRCKYLKVERALLSCEEGFVYPGDRTFCLKRIGSYRTFLNVKIVNIMKDLLQIEVGLFLKSLEL